MKLSLHKVHSVSVRDIWEADDPDFLSFVYLMLRDVAEVHAEQEREMNRRANG